MILCNRYIDEGFRNGDVLGAFFFLAGFSFSSWSLTVLRDAPQAVRPASRPAPKIARLAGGEEKIFVVMAAPALPG